MKITCVVVGKIKEKYFTDAIKEYSKRLSRYCKLEIVELADEKTPDGASEAEEVAIREKEGERILKALKDDAYVIALAIEGKMLDSVELSQKIDRLGVSGTSHIAFVIGGSLGLAPAVMKRADYALSFSRMTFPHQLMRVVLLEQLYRKWGISDKTNFSAMGPEDWPIAEDLYAVLEDAYEHYDQEDSPLYPRELLRELLLGLHSMCRGAESVYFNGRTNITSARFLVFGVKDLIHANSSVKDALLFNLLSYLSDQLLTKGNTVAALDELYLWLSNLTTIEYIRNCLKRVRKRNSALILASQNLEDFDIQGVRELTRPLFAIPTHQFLFHGGKVDKKFYMDNLQLESAEYDLISSPNNGVCLFKSGADRNLLDVHAPPHKHALITGGGG